MIIDILHSDEHIACAAKVLESYHKTATYKVKQVILSCETYQQLVVAKRMLNQQLLRKSISSNGGKYLNKMIEDKLRVVLK